MRRQIAALIVGMLVFPQLAAAQTLVPGARVRFSHPGEGTRTGTFVALTADTLEVALSERTEPTRLPLDQVTRLDVSHGMQRQLLRRAGIGFLVGGVVGGVGVAASESGCHASSGQFCLGVGGGAILGGIFFGAVGGVLGLVAGVIPSESWERVKLEQQRISLVAPSVGRGRGVGLRYAF